MCSLGLPWDSGSNDGHHELIILIQLIIGKVEEKEELIFFIDIGYPIPMVTRKTIIEVLEESADLIFIGFYSREDNYGFTKIERWACC
jgi:hypothetical protein